MHWPDLCVILQFFFTSIYFHVYAQQSIPKTDCFFQISFENLQKQPQTKSMITQFVRQLLAKTLQLQEKERDWPKVCL